MANSASATRPSNRYIWADRRRGGSLHRHLRCAIKQRRKRYGAYDSRGRLAGKTMIQDRPAYIAHRRQLGHWEIDTVLGKGSRHCIVSLVERKSGYLQIAKIRARNVEQTTAATIALISRHPHRFKTITADNGNRVPRLSRHREGHRRALLLRHSAPRLGARYQREHQRVDPSVTCRRAAAWPGSLSVIAMTSPER